VASPGHHVSHLRPHYFLQENPRGCSTKTRRTLPPISSPMIYILSFSLPGRIYHSSRFQSLSIRMAPPPPYYIYPPLTSLLKGGRLVAERRMVTDIYMFDIETFTWEKIPQNPDSDQPRARYFHSTDACEFPFPSYSMPLISHCPVSPFPVFWNPRE
jgi:hypothetical protein